MANRKRALLIVAKRPLPGQTKTRLCPPLSPERACTLYEAFLHDTLDIARQVHQVEHEIVYWPEAERLYFERLAPDFGLVLQSGGGLGERLDNAMTSCLQQGFDQVVVMDSDSPTLSPALVARAFELLEQADVVLGPCDDGGYYLIGLVHPQPRLLREVEMSTPHVLRDTVTLAKRENLNVELLPTWYDIDRASSIRRLEQELPTLPENQARHTRRMVRRAWRQPLSSRP